MPASARTESAKEEDVDDEVHATQHAITMTIVLRCEHCKETFEYTFQGPAAIECGNCGGVFDARLQMFKELRKYFRDNVENPY